jgi:hypothetical protein
MLSGMLSSGSEESVFIFWAINYGFSRLIPLQITAVPLTTPFLIVKGLTLFTVWITECSWNES